MAVFDSGDNIGHVCSKHLRLFEKVHHLISGQVSGGLVVYFAYMRFDLLRRFILGIRSGRCLQRRKSLMSFLFLGW
jgi:hypothetical protein